MERKVCLPGTVKWPLFQIMKTAPVGVCAGVKTLGPPLVLRALQFCQKPACVLLGLWATSFDVQFLGRGVDRGQTGSLS